MALPGFTAEASLKKHETTYVTAIALAGHVKANRVIPQACCTCADGRRFNIGGWCPSACAQCVARCAVKGSCSCRGCR